MKELKTDILVQFIKDNDLDFTGTGSELNGDCVVLAGFADFHDVLHVNTLIRAIKVQQPGTSSYKEELSRVFDFAKEHNYGDWWHGEAAHGLYKF